VRMRNFKLRSLERRVKLRSRKVEVYIDSVPNLVELYKPRFVKVKDEKKYASKAYKG